MQHHGSKSALFRSAVRLDAQAPAEVAAHLREVVEARMAGLPPEMLALVRSMLTVPEAAAAMRDHLDERARNLAGAMDGPDAEIRAAFTVCAVLGLTLGRHFLHLGAFDAVSDEDLARSAGEWIRHAAEADPNASRPTA